MSLCNCRKSVSTIELTWCKKAIDGEKKGMKEKRIIEETLETPPEETPPEETPPETPAEEIEPVKTLPSVLKRVKTIREGLNELY